MWESGKIKIKKERDKTKATYKARKSAQKHTSKNWG